MNEHATSLAVEHLFTMHLNLGNYAIMPSGPHGTRVFAPVLDGIVSGPRLHAKVLPGADWVTVRADGWSKLDVRLTLIADDGAVIAMAYQGVLGTGSERRPRVAPLFEAAHEKYTWLNNVQAIGIGTPGKNQVSYEIYALA